MESSTVPQTILIVEDEEETREILVQILAMRYPGVTFLEAHDGSTALECIRSRAPQIVISDISLPGRDGIALSREIGALCAEVKLIIISAHETEYLASRFAEVATDVYGYLSKPVEFPLLFATLDRCIAELPLH